MLLHVNALHVAELENAVQAMLPEATSVHVSDAVAAGLGFRSARRLTAALHYAEDGFILHRIDNGAFCSRLAEVVGLRAEDAPMLTAALRAVPHNMRGESDDETVCS